MSIPRLCLVFFFKQKTAYEMRISDWSSDVCSSDLAKAACNDKTCGLPRRVQSVTRQGVTVAVLDAFDDIDEGHTGIWLIDSWVASVVRRPRKMRVLSPDRMPPRYRQKTWPGKADRKSTRLNSSH